MKLVLPALLCLAATSGCGGEPRACGAGFERWPDGNCYPAGLQGTGSAPELPTSTSTTGSTGGPTTGSAEPVYDGPTYVESGSSHCNVDDTAMYVDIRARGWVMRGTVAIFGTGLATPDAEEQTLGDTEWDPNGWWDNLEVGPLTDDLDPAYQVDRESTRFDCGDEDADLLTFAARAWDLDGNVVDCAVWGNDPALVIAGGVPMDGIEEPADFSGCFAL